MHSGEILSKFFFMPDTGHLIMVCIGFFFIYLAISRKIETALFLPFGFGIILMNIPGSDGAEGIFKLLYETGILNGEVLPLLLFLGIGAMTDFSPLIQKPGYMLLGIIGQSGIIAAVFLARCLGYEFNDAVSAGIIGAADGPTAIVVGTRLNTRYLASVIVASYSYMALVPLVQPLAIRLLTTKKERKLSARCVVPPLKKEKLILFPLIAMIVCGILAPKNASLLGFLMLGNLIRECGILLGLSKTLSTVLVDVVTVLLALALSFNLRAENILNTNSLEIMVIGFAAFFMNISAGIISVKLFNLLAPLLKKEKINPIVGSAANSAFPISSRVAQTQALKSRDDNIILSDALAANCAGQIATIFSGGILMAIFS